MKALLTSLHSKLWSNIIVFSQLPLERQLLVKYEPVQSFPHFSRGASTLWGRRPRRWRHCDTKSFRTRKSRPVLESNRWPRLGIDRRWHPATTDQQQQQQLQQQQRQRRYLNIFRTWQVFFQRLLLSTNDVKIESATSNPFPINPNSDFLLVT